ncbi:MAG: SDR family NAD(P)-dependent oxidoreductase [Endozoicomonas sp.]|uniref:SDR family NAD(P)-dependent oxidoreductase n=1 Tax=Endozoicomonas sp. TaxID=1892382 RepID=UPI003D9B4885
MKDFKGKVAVVTGGASGVGRALAIALAREGAKVVVSDVEVGALDSVISEITASGHECFGQKADVTDGESMKALAQATLENYGAIHLVFANAGVGTGEAGMMWDYDVNDWEWGFRVNTWGVIHSINAFMPKLVEQNEEAHFVVTGSGNGAFLMMPNTPIYTATKAAVQAITENLHYQCLMSQSPVKVSALFPGPHVVNSGIFNSERNRPDDLPMDPDKPDSGISSVDDMKTMMAEYGRTLETTEPSEVAEFALQELRKDKFWIAPTSEKSKAAFRQRADSILNCTNPTPPDVL